MRCSVGIVLMVLGCRCSGPGDDTVTYDGQELEASEYGSDGGAPELADDLCFGWVDPELEALFPAVRERLVEAGSRWGWPVRFDASCASTVELVDDERFARLNDQPFAAMANRGPGKVGMAYKGGWSHLALREGSIDNVGDVTIDECLADARETEQAGVDTRQRILVYLLTHEIGHAVLSDRNWHSDDEYSPIYNGSWRCYDAEPNEDELAMVVGPAH